MGMDGPQETRREHEERRQEITLKEHIVALLTAEGKANDAGHVALSAQIAALGALLEGRMNAMDTAVGTAMDANEKRFENTNEWRSTVEGWAKTYVSIDTHLGAVKVLQTELAELKEKVAKLQLNEAVLAGKASQAQLWFASALGMISLGMAVTGMLMKAKGG